MENWYVGPHVSAAGGAHNAPVAAEEIKATAFGVFVKNQKQWFAPEVTAEQRARFGAAMNTTGYTAAQVLPHAGYLINLANPDAEAHDRSVNSLIDEVKRCHAFGLTMLNLHPGSHLKKLAPEAALSRVAAAINDVLAATEGVTIVIENTAGQGGSLGVTMAELGAILAEVDDKARLGFCLDTCHAFAAGYDVRTAAGITALLDEFEAEVGPASEFLRGMHLNDAKSDYSSRVDRHAPLGMGNIGWEPFRTIMRDKRCAGIPLVIETPDEMRWPDEIAKLISFSV
ncbi:MAG: deoxyribonuclease IV [Lentisphaerae bacterium]|nr:deoxyribonuclease IV [Lentisphaerota bacterium]